MAITLSDPPINTPMYEDARLSEDGRTIVEGKMTLTWVNWFNLLKRVLQINQTITGRGSSTDGVAGGSSAAAAVLPQRRQVQYTGGISVTDDRANDATIIEGFDFNDVLLEDGDGSGLDADTVRGVDVDDLQYKFRLLLLYLVQLGFPLPPELEEDFSIAAAQEGF